MIHPTAFIAPGALVLGDVSLGPDTSVWYLCVLRGDTDPIHVGACSNIQDLSVLHADPGFPCLVGDRVTVGHRAILHGCTVEDDCLIGMGAIVLNGARIGAGSVVGAGALVREGTIIPPASLIVGAPARILRPVDDQLAARSLATWRHYVENARRHRSGAFPLHNPPPPAGNPPPDAVET